MRLDRPTAAGHGGRDLLSVRPGEFEPASRPFVACAHTRTSLLLAGQFPLWEPLQWEGRMDARLDRVGALSEREKATLRLLAAGHDAKSMANSLGLSVHTVNERLRDARRKLAVSSSREAARLLADVEREAPNFLGDKEIGVAPTRQPLTSEEPSATRAGGERPFAWFGGGMLVMAVIIAAVTAASIFLAVGPSRTSPVTTVAAAAQTVQETAGTKAARDWLALLDQQKWDASWGAAGAAFKTMPKARWATTAQGVRQPLGAVSSRLLQSVTATTSLPGAPVGEYEVAQFKSTYAQREVIETVVLSREGASWAVNGYFIR